MAKPAPHVTDAEFAVLAVLWDDANRSCPRVDGRRLYPACTLADVATVQKLVQRLEKKGLVRRDRSERVHRFSAVLPRTQFAGQQLSQLAEKLSGGSLTPLLVHLVENNRLNRRELDEAARVAGLSKKAKLTQSRGRHGRRSFSSDLQTRARQRCWRFVSHSSRGVWRNPHLAHAVSAHRAPEIGCTAALPNPG